MREHSAPVASLGLVGDGDEMDIVRDLERAFGIDFGTRPKTWATVADIERDLLALYPAAEASGLCDSAMAFRHLRAVLPGPNRAARPDSPLARLVPGKASRRLDERARLDGLVVMASQGGVFASVGFLMGFAGLLLLAPLLLFGHLWAGVMLIAVGVALVVVDRGTPRDTTLGELARLTAAMNFAHFASRGADRRATAIRESVRCILGRGAGLDAGRIGPKTRLLG